MKAVTPPDLPVGQLEDRSAFGCFLFAAFALFVGGCANVTDVKVDSLAKPKAEDAISYQIHNSNPLVADDSLRYKEAAEYVKTALSGRGMYEAPPNTKADVVVDLDYGISSPEIRREIIPEPVYRIEPGRVYQAPVIIIDPVSKRPMTVMQTVQEPDRQVFDHFEDRPITVVVYEKYLRLSARENAPASEGRPPADVWTVDVTSEGESRDLRKNLPVLVAATIDYVGKDTHGQKTIKIKDSDRDVGFVKKGM